MQEKLKGLLAIFVYLLVIALVAWAIIAIVTQIISLF
jgi:hypothetical protein